MHSSRADLVLLCAIGALGFLLRAWNFPIAPVIIGLLLGPMAEQQLARALAIGGDARVLVARPVSAGLLAVALLVLAWPAIVAVLRSRQPR